MLTITAKTQYGLYAMFELAEHYGKDLVQIRDIVSRRKVPKNYLEQILNRLSKNGVIKSVRGNKGGYELAKNPEKITILDIIVALEGEISLQKVEWCVALNEVLGEAENKVKEALSIPLQTVLDRQREIEQKQLMFHI